MCAAFSHIYLESRAEDYPETKRLLDKFSDSTVVSIRHYKDVFNRPAQDSRLQNGSKSLILAVNDGKKIFDASPVCQDFGMGKFYYAESAMNCVFSCDYCFLKGMYGTSNVVIFVNQEDYLKECEEKLKEGPVYLCASFDTDLGALSKVSGWMNVWEGFASTHPDLTLELRTKSVVDSFRNDPNIIYAFTLSPDEVIDQFEKMTPSLDARIACVNQAIAKGAQVRLCFDPLIYIKNFELCYNRFVDKILQSIDLTRVRDISIGTFRISSDYLPNLRKACPDSSAVLFPFDREDGFCVYPADVRSRLIGIIKNELEKAGYGNKLYIIP